MEAYTNYPISVLGDKPGKLAPIRYVTIIGYDGNKYCWVKANENNYHLWIKAGYLYLSLADLESNNPINVRELPLLDSQTKEFKNEPTVLIQAGEKRGRELEQIQIAEWLVKGGNSDLAQQILQQKHKK